MTAQSKKPHWAVTGAMFGGLLFILQAFINPLVREEAITVRSVLVSFVFSMLAGLAFGRFQHWLRSRSKG